MIYTITLNPSLDYYIKIKQLRIGEMNRSSKEEIYPGGKGINVSILLGRLGVETTALGLKAGFVGEQIEELLESENVKTRFIDCEGNSRINVKIDGNPETQINGDGPKMKTEYIGLLCNELGEVGADDILVLAGSAPRSLGTGIYKKIIESLPCKDTKVVVDAAGSLFKDALEMKPFLVKPNVEELSALFGVEIRSDEDAIFYAKKLIDMGARNVIVSLGVNGGLMITEEGEIITCRSPRGEVVNTIGAGDALVAGFISSYEIYGDYKRAFYYGIRCGSATACSKGIARADDIRNKYKAVIFDLDGTILNTIDDLADAVNYTLKQYGQSTYTIDEIRGFVGKGNRNLMKEAVPGGEDCETFEQEYDVFYKYYLEHLNIKSEVYPGVLDVLKELKRMGIPLGVVSNKNEEAVRQLMDEYFPGIFDAVVGDNMVRAKKPAKDSVYAALALLGKEYNNNNVLYVGDSGVDSLTAECAAMDCVLVSWGFRPKEELIDYTNMTIIDNPNEILYFVK